jgi:hydroxyacylglutathione hydrolase
MNIFDGLHAFIWQNYRENNCNAYFIDDGKRILIDPGHKHLLSHVEQGLQAAGVSWNGIDVILITHGHPDHMEGVAQLGDQTVWGMNQKEHEFVSEMAGRYFQMPEPDFFLGAGDLILGKNRFEVIVTPGHSPGSICLYWPGRKALFTGDLIFQQGIGRTDLPGGDGNQLKESIRKIAALDVEYLLPGHGSPVVGAEAVQENFRIVERQWFDYI